MSAPGWSQRSGPLDEVLREAGARMHHEHGATVPADFGSSAGELAVCLQAVGIGDRADLVVLELRGTKEVLPEALRRATGKPPLPDSAGSTPDAWWCPVSDTRVLVLCEDDRRASVARRLDALGRDLPGVACHEVSGDYEALAVVGPRAEALVHAACPSGGGDRLMDAGFATVTVGGASVLLLREEPWQYLAVAPRSSAAEVWRALSAAGGGLGLGYVGSTALHNFAVQTHLRARQTHA